MRYQNIFIEVIESTSRGNGTKRKNGTFLRVETFLRFNSMDIIRKRCTNGPCGNVLFFQL